MLARLTGQPRFEEAPLAVHAHLGPAIHAAGGLLPLLFDPVTGLPAGPAHSRITTLGEERVPSWEERRVEQEQSCNT